MRIARLLVDGQAVPAIAEDEGYRLVEDPFAAVVRRRGRWVPAAEATLLAPVEPRTVVGMAHNTGADDRLLPPQAFLKPARSVVGPGEPIPLPPVGLVEAEAELAVVIGREVTGGSAAEALDAVLGYTVANDVTARDLQATDPLWTSAKGQRGFTPLGPWIETELDPVATLVGVAVDGRPASSASSADLARSVAEVVAWAASWLPLGPGDVVLVGAPGRPVPIQAGQEVAVTVAGIGTLRNPVVAAGLASARGAA